MEQLGDLDGIVSSVSFNSCICIGDFNTDLWKARSTRFSKAFQTFMYNHGMSVCCTSQDTWFLEIFNVLMPFDHNMAIVDSEVWNSDHIPVLVTIPFVEKMRQRKDERLAWYQASLEQLVRYSELLGCLLDVVPVPAEAAICCEPNSCEHCTAIAKYYNDIFYAVSTAAKACIPVKKHRKICRPGWSGSIREAKENALRFYQRWRSEGKTRDGPLYRDTCDSRRKFKRCLKKWKREEAKITGRKLLDELENGNQAKFWDKLKRGCPEVALSVSCSSRIGQVSKVPEILDLWRAHFGSLGNSQEECVYTKHRDEYRSRVERFGR